MKVSISIVLVIGLLVVAPALAEQPAKAAGVADAQGSAVAPQGAPEPSVETGAKAFCMADCWDGSYVWCTGAVCSARDSSCPLRSGHVTCDGVSTSCPICPFCSKEDDDCWDTSDCRPPHENACLYCNCAGAYKGTPGTCICL